jgi:hypothetical protein
VWVETVGGSLTSGLIAFVGHILKLRTLRLRACVLIVPYEGVAGIRRSITLLASRLQLDLEYSKSAAAIRILNFEGVFDRAMLP